MSEQQYCFMSKRVTDDIVDKNNAMETYVNKVKGKCMAFINVKKSS